MGRPRPLRPSLAQTHDDAAATPTHVRFVTAKGHTLNQPRLRREEAGRGPPVPGEGVAQGRLRHGRTPVGLAEHRAPVGRARPQQPPRTVGRQTDVGATCPQAPGFGTVCAAGKFRAGSGVVAAVLSHVPDGVLDEMPRLER